MRLSTEAAQIVDQNTRDEIYAELQNAVAADAPFVELYYQPYIYARTDKLQGWTVYPTGNYHLEEAWLSS